LNELLEVIVTTTISRAEVAKAVARALLSAGCVTLRTDEPFRLPSGWASPAYMDCRRINSFPAIRRELISLGLDLLKSCGCLDGVASIVGGEASGIALAAWLSDALDLPLQYVRKKPVGRTQIEGVINPGDGVLLVDDVMAGGHSKVTFCRALAAAGATVKDVFVIFDYGTFPTLELLAPLGVTVHALATWQDVLSVARETGAFGPPALAELADFLSDPPRWSQAHGGIATLAAAR
jgi:orotate phosphoribosyltransferase